MRPWVSSISESAGNENGLGAVFAIMNIIVSGCAGFIGAKVCELLVERGDFVFGLDNMSDAYDVRLKQSQAGSPSQVREIQFFRIATYRTIPDFFLCARK